MFGQKNSVSTFCPTRTGALYIVGSEGLFQPSVPDGSINLSGKVFHVDVLSTNSSSDHSRSVTLAAIAGVTRRVLWTRTLAELLGDVKAAGAPSAA
jgi:hypothetical protein